MSDSDTFWKRRAKVYARRAERAEADLQRLRQQLRSLREQWRIAERGGREAFKGHTDHAASYELGKADARMFCVADLDALIGEEKE